MRSSKPVSTDCCSDTPRLPKVEVLAEKTFALKSMFCHRHPYVPTGFSYNTYSSINQGPPINVTPGSYANVDKAIEHYKKLNEETEEKRLAIEQYYREKARQRA